MENKFIASVNVSIPYRSTGNTILQKEVVMDILRGRDNDYIAVPNITLQERRLANVPDELHFEMKEGKGYSKRGLKEGNSDLINDIIIQLKEQNKL